MVSSELEKAPPSWIALLLGGLLALGVFTITVGHFLATDDAISQADAIVVLGGDGGNFFRVQQGANLFNEGYAPVVVFSGGTLKDAGIACSSAQLSLEAAQELGLPTGAAIIASGAQSTYDEAVNIRRLALQHRWHSLIVVTDLFHTRRAARTFRALLPDTTIYLSAALILTTMQVTGGRPSSGGKLDQTRCLH